MNNAVVYNVNFELITSSGLNDRRIIQYYHGKISMKKKRPLGVVIFCSLGLILIAMNLLPRIVPPNASKIIFLIPWLIVYYFLFSLRNWARLTLCILHSISAALLIVFLFSAILFKPSVVFMHSITFLYWLNYTFSVIVSLAFVYYFTRPRVKGYFSEEHRGHKTVM